jgi:fucose 4-O-acetylase-like acetyltransferase
MGQDPWIIVMTGFVKRALAFGGVFWFLPCLFLSKLIFWTFHKYTPNFILWSILIALVILGFVLHHFSLFPQKWWYVHQVFDLTIFLGVGQFLKTNSSDLKVYYRYGTALFLIFIVFFLITKLPTPTILYTYKIQEWWQLPVHFIVSIGGTAAILWISQTINSNSFLEFFGRGTIVVYGVHQLFLKNLLRYIDPLIANQGVIISIIMFLVIFFCTVGFSVLALKAFNSKYLKPIIGK